MVALYPRLMALCVVSMGLLGCSGRTIEGVWYGPMPGSGWDNCRIELHRGGVAQASCLYKPPVFWYGTFRLEGGRFFLHREIVQVDRGLLRGWNLEQEFKVAGPGNQMTLTDSAGGTYVWERRPQ